MIRIFRFSPSRLAFAYTLLSVLVLALFAIPLWYAWNVNISTFKVYVLGTEVQRMVDTFESEGATGIALVLGALIGWFIRRALLFEVREISRTASAIVEGGSSRRLAMGGRSNELDTLARTVNGM